MPLKFHEPTPGQFAMEGTGLLDTIFFALCAGPGVGIINELAHDGPYREGPLSGFITRKKSGRFSCPYCNVGVLHYQYRSST
jgi:hypothetical protein